MSKYDLNNIYEWPITTRYLIIGLLCAIVFYLGFLLDISGLKQDITNNESQLDNLKQQLIMVINHEAKLETETAQLPKLEENLIEWNKKLINYKDLPELLNEILKMGENNQLHFTLFNPGTESKVDIYTKLPIKIIAVGSYHQLANFISQIANMSWIVVIGDFSISKENKNDVLGSKLAEEANTQNLLTAEMMLEVYYLGQDGTGGEDVNKK